MGTYNRRNTIKNDSWRLLVDVVAVLLARMSYVLLRPCTTCSFPFDTTRLSANTPLHHHHLNFGFGHLNTRWCCPACCELPGFAGLRQVRPRRLSIEQLKLKPRKYVSSG